MPSAIQADLNRANLAVVETMGSSAVHTPKVGPAQTLSLVPVDPTHLEWLEPGQWNVRWAATSQFTTRPQNGDLVTIDGENFDIINVRARHAGSIFLVLGKKK